MDKRALRTHVEGDQLAKCGELRLSFDVDVQIASACVQDSDVAVKAGGVLCKLLLVSIISTHRNAPRLVRNTMHNGSELCRQSSASQSATRW